MKRLKMLCYYGKVQMTRYLIKAIHKVLISTFTSVCFDGLVLTIDVTKHLYYIVDDQLMKWTLGTCSGLPFIFEFFSSDHRIHMQCLRVYYIPKLEFSWLLHLLK